MRFARVLIAVLYLWPVSGLANQSVCVGASCGASATIAFKIVIPPRPLSTRLPPALTARHARETVLSPHAGGSKRPEGIVYIVSENGERPLYTVAKP